MAGSAVILHVIVTPIVITKAQGVRRVVVEEQQTPG
jgi:hypothetical protein